MTLAESLRAAVAFDNAEPPNGFDFERGRQRENARLMPYLEKLIAVAEAAERMRHGTGFRGEHYEEDADTFDEALARLRESVEGK